MLSYEQNTQLQDLLEAWANAELVPGLHEWANYEHLLELVQETLPAQPPTTQELIERVIELEARIVALEAPKPYVPMPPAFEESQHFETADSMLVPERERCRHCGFMDDEHDPNDDKCPDDADHARANREQLEETFPTRTDHERASVDAYANAQRILRDYQALPDEDKSVERMDDALNALERIFGTYSS